MRWKKSLFFVFFLEIHSHKKERRRREYLHNMHSCIRYQQIRQRRWMERKTEVACNIKFNCVSVETTTPSSFMLQAMFSRATYAFMLRSFQNIFCRSTFQQSFMLRPVTKKKNKNWRCVHANKRKIRSRSKKTRSIVWNMIRACTCPIFCISVRSEYSARSAAVRAFVP